MTRSYPTFGFACSARIPTHIMFLSRARVALRRTPLVKAYSNSAAPAFLANARVTIMNEELPLKTVSRLTPAGDGRFMVQPYDPSLSRILRETLQDTLSGTGLKAFWCNRASKILVVPRSLRTDTKDPRPKQARRFSVDADLEAEASADVDFVGGGRRRKSSPRRPSANKFEAKISQLADESVDDFRVLKSAASGNKRVLRQLSKKTASVDV